MMSRPTLRIILLTALALLTFYAGRPFEERHRIVIKHPDTLRDFLSFTPDRIPLVSAHRGGARPGFPENCIATFENTIRYTWSMLEVDPRYSKDSAIVLMHDATLDRTTTGSGKVSDYTLEELRRLRLKDTEHQVTAHAIPTLDEAIEWARDKTVLILDQKDVPIEARVKKIQEHRAQSWVGLIVYSLEDAGRCYELDRGIVMEVMIPDTEAMEKFEKTGIPWQNVIAFVTHTAVKDPGIFRKLHDKGVMCIRGSSRTIDREYTGGKITADELARQYRDMTTSGADIIEADLGIEAGQALRSLKDPQSSKHRFFLRP